MWPPRPTRALSSAGSRAGRYILTRPSPPRASSAIVRPGPVLRRDVPRSLGPGDCRGGVIPAHSAFGLWPIEPGHRIDDFAVVGEGQVPVGAPFGDVDHRPVLFIQLRGERLQVGGRGWPEIDEDVE